MDEKFQKLREFHIERYLEFFDREENILDVGSHDDTFSLVAKKVGKNVKSIDWTPRNSNVIKGTATEIPFGDGIFEGVLLSHVIEHMHLEDAQKAISEIHRVLKPEGKLVLATPHHSTFNRLFWEEPSHIMPCPVRVVEDLFFGKFETKLVKNRVRSNQILLHALKKRFSWIYKIILPFSWYFPKAYRETILVAEKMEEVYT